MKILGLTKNYFKNIAEENISQEFRLKNTDKTRNNLIEKIKQNELITKKYKKICKILNYTDHLLILASTVTGCVSISGFASLVDTPVATASSVVGINFFEITAVIKKHKSISKKKRNMIKQYY